MSCPDERLHFEEITYAIGSFMDGYVEIVVSGIATVCSIVCGLRLTGGTRGLRDAESELVQ